MSRPLTCAVPCSGNSRADIMSAGGRRAQLPDGWIPCCTLPFPAAGRAAGAQAELLSDSTVTGAAAARSMGSADAFLRHGPGCGFAAGARASGRPALAGPRLAGCSVCGPVRWGQHAAAWLGAAMHGRILNGTCCTATVCLLALAAGPCGCELLASNASSLPAPETCAALCNRGLLRLAGPAGMTGRLVCVPAVRRLPCRGMAAVCVACSHSWTTAGSGVATACLPTTACSPAMAASTRLQTSSTPANREVTRSMASSQELMRAIWSSSFVAVADAPPAMPCRLWKLPAAAPGCTGVAAGCWELMQGSWVDSAGWLSVASCMAGGEVMYMAVGRCGRQPRTDVGCAYWTPGFGCDRHTGTSCMQMVTTLRLVLSKGTSMKLQQLSLSDTDVCTSCDCA